ncbi:hypothetical protein B9Z55_027715 [Caenorhabditis nigoni]|uniref:Uncharacterized protein n=1 Tax=Caenorhabditis nigoni TaxID=1611254 RepID=A0A2G5SEZ5_9PELO|nr:hypothetical protein B9Z55_027715 [Caenorhabditis nigoni]
MNDDERKVLRRFFCPPANSVKVTQGDIHLTILQIIEHSHVPINRKKKKMNEIIIQLNPVAFSGPPLLIKRLLKLMGETELEIRIPNGSPGSSTCSTSLYSSPATSVTNTPSPTPATVSPPEYRNLPLLYTKELFADEKSHKNGFILVPDKKCIYCY